MNNYNLRTLILGIMIASFVIMPTTILAHVLEEPTHNAIDAELEEIKAERNKAKQDIEKQKNIDNAADRCKRVSNRLETMSEKYDQGKIRYVNRFRSIVERLNKLEEYLVAKSIETHSLPGYINTFESKVNTFEVQVAEAITIFAEAKVLACEQKDGSYREKIARGREVILDARITALDIHNYFLDVIRMELKAIKENTKTDETN